ncbi:MAG: efflux RND transporter periplasmic adaptor subunit [Thermodesulfobacteriota bacterium]
MVERRWCLLVATVATFFGACGQSPQEQPNPAERPLITAVYAYGIVEARRHSTLSAKFPGKLERILVAEGEPVAEGQVLAVFEARELQAAAASAEAAVKVVEAQLAEARAGARAQELILARERLRETEAVLAKAELDWTRAQGLHHREAMADEAWETARLGRQRAEAGRNAARAALALLEEGTRPEALAVLERQLAAAQARLQEARTALGNARLTAPFAGIVTRKHREEGEAMDIGLPVLDVATVGDRYIRAEVDETDIGRLRLEQPVHVSADGFPGLELAGTVRKIQSQMGAKRLIPTDPAKIVDYKVLEVEISLPADCPYPLKLPVNVRISLEPPPR